MRGLNFDHLSQMQRGPDSAGLDSGPEDGVLCEIFWRQKSTTFAVR